MQPNARKKSHRGISRSTAPCSASNNHRVADESHSMSIADYMTRTGRPPKKQCRRLGLSGRPARLLFIWSFDLGLGDPAGDLRGARELRAIPSAAQRLKQLNRCSHRLGAKRIQVLLVRE